MRCKIYGDRVKLFDSYAVSKSKFKYELDKLYNLHPTCRLWYRSTGSLINEWRSHNLAYKLGIKRDKTKDCDLNYELKWYQNLCYWIVGNIAWLFIK